MDSNPQNTSEKILKLRYIDGKSYKWLLKHLLLQGIDKNEGVLMLKSLNENFKGQRIKRAKKDLLISFVFIAIPLINFLLFYFDLLKVKFGIIEICCLFAFRPFFLSYYRVIRDQNKF